MSILKTLNFLSVPNGTGIAHSMKGALAAGVNKTLPVTLDGNQHPFIMITRGKQSNMSKKKGTLGVRSARARGMKREDGEWVSAGTVLAKQLGVLYFPGLNVGLGRTRDLFAMEHGYVMITTEKVNPDWNSKVMQNFFGQYANKDVPIYKTYFHVITEPMPRKFKLVDQV